MIGVVPDQQEPQKPPPDYACAGERHFEDASYLHSDGRLLNADHLFGLAVECLMKGLLLRFAGAQGVSMANRGGQVSDRLWWDNPVSGKRESLSHIGHMIPALPLLTHGRSGPALLEALADVTADFEKWVVDDRYTDGTHLDQPLMARRQKSAVLVSDLHQHVQITGKLP